MTVTIGIAHTSGSHELNMANGNFGLVWRSLGLVNSEDFCDWCCGNIDPDELLARLAGFKPSSITYDAYQVGNMYDCGVDLNRASRYYWSLMNIANEAKRKGRQVSWC